MISLNWPAILGAGLIPLVVGAAYYSFFANAWLKSAGQSEDPSRKGNPVVIYGSTLVFGMFLAVFIMPIVLHAVGVFSLVMTPDGMAETSQPMQDAMAYFGKYGGNFRTFKHGALHGLMTALFGAWPIVGTAALFEGRSWKYTGIHLGYWAITLMLMGGVVCAYGIR